MHKRINIYALSQDPVYIGTGGYTIGRVDNTIVRDPMTKIPKIPGSSLAGSWRYYTTLSLQGFFKKNFADIKDILDENGDIKADDVRELVNRKADNDLKDDKEQFYRRQENFMEYAQKLKESLDKDKKEVWQLYWGNLISSIKCAGQDDKSELKLNDVSAKDLDKTGHCGHCLICKAFGFSKRDQSWQGLVFFSDLNILFFPVNSRFGVRWITSPSILKNSCLNNKVEKIPEVKDGEVIVSSGDEEKGFINLGWMNFKIKGSFGFNSIIDFLGQNVKSLIKDKIIMVSENLLSQIINANLEVRTSVSIDPLTGAAKDSALFTSEAIPRGTVFTGNIRIMERITDDNDLSVELIKKALKDSKIYYETFGIGGLVTRGFGRLGIFFGEEKNLE